MSKQKHTKHKKRPQTLDEQYLMGCTYLMDVDLKGLVSNLRELMKLMLQKQSSFSSPQVLHCTLQVLEQESKEIEPYSLSAAEPYRLEVFKERMPPEYRWNDATPLVEEGLNTCCRILLPSALRTYIDAYAKGWCVYLVPQQNYRLFIEEAQYERNF